MPKSAVKSVIMSIASKAYYAAFVPIMHYYSFARFTAAASGANTGRSIISGHHGNYVKQSAVSISSSSKKDSMKDEYGVMDSTGELFTTTNFALESGEVLPVAQACYRTFGNLNAAKDNALVICHALTGNAALDQWWGSMLGPGQAFDTSKYFVVCANVLGSCYGSTGPQSTNPATGKPYGISFPIVSVRDSVELHMRMLKEGLGVKKVSCVIGGSMGGMQALEWAIMGSSNGSNLVQNAVIIGCGAQHTAWQIGISETQRQAIYADARWNDGHINPASPPDAGLGVARQIAMVSYRTAASYQKKFGREIDEKSGQWQVQRYLTYQGKKFLDRFDAVTYVRLTQLMDTHDVGRNRGGAAAALQSITARVLVMGMDSDIIYPLPEQQEMADNIPGAEMKVISTENGHDGFLLEQEQVAANIVEFLAGR